ncbi:PIN domain-containing protein [Rufibacter sediminis]|uniref:DUF4935 domain-containing protein n=1 Tax=Rufibacter sediminis TaxID=2762756 RepID=A0ABR6VWR2_9BACT|nr:PIN domain-containing protein [Rufibacter sediminis]MBC3541395.1 DUF4935 domain-containing protein [Rufibacter sediminis]
MSGNLKTKNISLDTSFIEAQNFINGNIIKELGKFGREKRISIYMTDITLKEVHARFRKNLLQLEEKIKKPLNTLKSAGFILKNFNTYDALFNLPNYDTESLLQDFQAQFENWIKVSRITIINTAHLTIGDVFNDYFSNNPPFREGEKKHEFPDAFTLKGLEDYFSKKGESTYVISPDKDLQSKTSKTLIVVADGGLLLDTVNRTSSNLHDQELIDSIEQLFKVNKDSLLKDLELDIEWYIENELVNSPDYFLVSRKVTNVSNTGFEEFLITQLDEKGAVVTSKTTISFTAELSFFYNNKALYDPEHNSWFSSDNTNYQKSIVYSKAIPVTLIVYTKSEHSIRYETIKLSSLNNSYPLGIYELAMFNRTP